MEEINARIRDFVLRHFLPDEPADSLGDETPLQTSGVLDSLAALELVAFLEKEFDIEIDVYDTSVERFDCIADIAAVVRRKQRLRQRKAS